MTIYSLIVAWMTTKAIKITNRTGTLAPNSIRFCLDYSYTPSPPLPSSCYHVVRIYNYSKPYKDSTARTSYLDCFLPTIFKRMICRTRLWSERRAQKSGNHHQEIHLLYPLRKFVMTCYEHEDHDFKLNFVAHSSSHNHLARRSYHKIRPRCKRLKEATLEIWIFGLPMGIHKVNEWPYKLLLILKNEPLVSRVFVCQQNMETVAKNYHESTKMIKKMQERDHLQHQGPLSL